MDYMELSGKCSAHEDGCDGLGHGNLDQGNPEGPTLLRGQGVDLSKTLTSTSSAVGVKIKCTRSDTIKITVIFVAVSVLILLTIFLLLQKDKFCLVPAGCLLLAGVISSIMWAVVRIRERNSQS